MADKLRSGEARRIFFCPDCEIGILDNKQNEEELKQYYRKHYRKEYKPALAQKTNSKKLFDSYVNFQQNRLKLIQPYLKKGKRLLEIGCSAGMFLYNVRDKVSEAVGMDFDLDSAAFARKKCGCEIYSDKLTETPLKEKSFDIICAFQVLEHVKSPVEFLSEVKKYLKDDGILFLEVPNVQDALISTYKLDYHFQFYFHSAHLYYYSRKALNLILKKAGFKGKFYFTQDYNVINHFNWIINDKPQGDCMPGLSNPVFPLRKNVHDSRRKKIEAFIGRMDREYKDLLSKLQLTSNIAFIGKKAG
jgi:2-polyprenyl-3-methyl-5-hydroxy-6-metoxy-1,4-benzoquinol methylase